MKYLLDANIISYLADTDSPFHEAIRKRFHLLQDEDEVSLSILVLYELYYGMSHAEGKDIKPSILQTKKDICDSLSIIPLTENGAEIFGMLKSKYQKHTGLKKSALSRHTVDLMIASSVIDAKCILVSNDLIFSEIQKINSELQVKNWVLS